MTRQPRWIYCTEKVWMWEKKSPSGWERPTSIITIVDTNANPPAMLAICGWSGEAEITGGKMDTNKMLIRHGLQVPPPFPLAGGASWFPHHFPVRPSQGAAGMSEGVLFSARSGDAALPLVCLCLHGIHLLIWIYANAARGPHSQRESSHHQHLTITVVHSSSSSPPCSLCSRLPALFLFCACGLGADVCGNQLCFVTEI